MSEQEIESLIQAARRRYACHKQAEDMLEEILFKLKMKPDSMAILAELRYLLQFVENIQRKPPVIGA